MGAFRLSTTTIVTGRNITACNYHILRATHVDAIGIWNTGYHPFRYARRCRKDRSSRDLTIANFESTNPATPDPLVRFRNTTDAYLHGLRGPHKTRLFLEIAGARSARIVLVGNDYGAAERIVSFADRAKRDAVSMGRKNREGE